MKPYLGQIISYPLSLLKRNWRQNFNTVNYFLQYFLNYLFLERGEGKEERERNINVWLPLSGSLMGTRPATQAGALTGNQTSNPLVHRLALNPLSYPGQGNTVNYFF